MPFVQECGVVNRVTILTDKFGGAKGYAYIEFEKADAAVSAVLLDGSQLRNREIKVCGEHCCAVTSGGHHPGSCYQAC